MANKFIKWYSTTSAGFVGITTKDPNGLYFISDTKEIYKGAVPFTESVIMVDSFPVSGAQGKVYVHNTTLEGKVWTGSIWKTIIQSVATSLTDGDTTNTPVSGEAIKTYVNDKFSNLVTGKFVESIGYDTTNKNITYVKNGATQNVAIDGFITGATYDGSTGNLTFPVEGGTDIIITIPKDNFVKSGTYDSLSKNIILTMQNNSTVTIPAAALVDIYTASTTNSIITSVVGNNITASLKISAGVGNIATVNADGLYVPPTNISNKLDKVSISKAGEIIVANADGTITTSGVKAGNATLSGTPNAVTLATEAAVSAIQSALNTAINSKISISNISTTITGMPNETATASDSKVISEKLFSLRLEDVYANIQTLYQEKLNIIDIVSTLDPEYPSPDKVASEEAVVNALTWTVI